VNLPPGNLLDGNNDLAVGVTPSQAKVESAGVESVYPFQGHPMSLSDIRDMNIVTDACAVRCIIIGTIELKRTALTQSSRKQERYNMCLGPVVLAMALRRATGIEITEGDMAETMC
jgi:hypothetical protein